MSGSVFSSGVRPAHPTTEKEPPLMSEPTPFKFSCSNCQHSATDHSSRTGPKDMQCHVVDCKCEHYSSVMLDALARSRRS